VCTVSLCVPDVFVLYSSLEVLKALITVGASFIFMFLMKPNCLMLSFFIILMRIRIQIFHFNEVPDPAPLLSYGICNQWYIDPPGLYFEPPASIFNVHGPPRLCFEFLNFDFIADPEPVFYYNVDPDPASRNNADPFPPPD
jgi:hypothetical protein